VLTGRATPSKTAKATAVVGSPSATVDDSVPEWALPDSVVVAMAELAETAREGLLALAVGDTGSVWAQMPKIRPGWEKRIAAQPSKEAAEEPAVPTPCRATHASARRGMLRPGLPPGG